MCFRSSNTRVFSRCKLSCAMKNVSEGKYNLYDETVVFILVIAVTVAESVSSNFVWLKRTGH